MRCLDVEVWRQAGNLLDEVIEQVAVPFGVKARVEHIRGVPPVVNTDLETTMLENAARAELGEDSIVLVEQSMGGEDFAWMLQEVPGSMFRLGTRAPGDPTYDLHQGDYAPSEQAIGIGVRVMAQPPCAPSALNWRRLRRLRTPSAMRRAKEPLESL